MCCQRSLKTTLLLSLLKDWLDVVNSNSNYPFLTFHQPTAENLGRKFPKQERLKHLRAKTCWLLKAKPWYKLAMQRLRRVLRGKLVELAC